MYLFNLKTQHNLIVYIIIISLIIQTIMYNVYYNR